jgi:predicted acylesterase/phospholipase RssA
MLLETDVEPESVGTFRYQYQHFTAPLIVELLLTLKEDVRFIRPVLRRFVALQEPGAGAGSEPRGRRSSWATAQWLIAARHFYGEAGSRSELRAELRRISAPECALVMKGGGVKGLALAGALIELSASDLQFDVFVGTSAGAVAAVLLAAGYSAEELEGILRETDFSDFLDPVPRRIMNIVRKAALHSGDPIGNWVRTLIEKKAALSGPDAGRDAQVGLPIQMDRLPQRAVIFASNRSRGTVVFDSRGERRETSAAFAVRCSMSIPFFFVTHEHEGEPIYDGGLLANFPLDKLLEANPEMDFVGLYLKEAPPTLLGRLAPVMLINIMLSRNDRELVQRNRDRVIVIDPSPVATTQFRLTSDEKDLLVWRGRAAALEYLSSRFPENVLQERLAGARAKVSEFHRKVVRRWRARRAILIAVVLALGASATLLTLGVI